MDTDELSMKSYQVFSRLRKGQSSTSRDTASISERSSFEVSQANPRDLRTSLYHPHTYWAQYPQLQSKIIKYDMRARTAILS